MIDFEDLIRQHNDRMAAFQAQPRIDQLEQLIKRTKANLSACLLCGNFQGVSESENLLAEYEIELRFLKEEKDGTKTT